MTTTRPVLLLVLSVLPLGAVALPTPVAEPASQRAMPVSGAAAPEGPREYISPAEVEQLIARVKSGPRDGTQLPGASRVMVAWGPYIGHVIYRVAPTKLYFANEDYAEFYVVLEGGGTMSVGGTIESPKRTGHRLESPTLRGGEPYRLSKGAMVMVPPGTAHRITTVEGELVYMSMHIPLQSGSSIVPARQ